MLNIKYRMIRLNKKIKSSPIDSNRFKVYLKELRKLINQNPVAWLEIK